VQFTGTFSLTGREQEQLLAGRRSVTIEAAPTETGTDFEVSAKTCSRSFGLWSKKTTASGHRPHWHIEGINGWGFHTPSKRIATNSSSWELPAMGSLGPGCWRTRGLRPPLAMRHRLPPGGVALFGAGPAGSHEVGP